MTILRSVLISISIACVCLATACLDRPVIEVSPNTTNVFVDQIRQNAIDKIDLLFMVDNSASMADKQQILQDAVPVLVTRLVSPRCVNADGTATNENSVNGKCTVGEPEFNPIGDIHIGIVSSSLGAHGSTGSTACAEGGPALNADDKGRLIGTMRPGLFDLGKSWNSSGFLAWDSSGTANTPAGTRDPIALQGAFKDMIIATGEHGCGYEASLESWYRFLIDPEPPARVTRVGNVNVRSSKLVVNADGGKTCVDCDDALLAQRKAFLRPDSLVAIVMLSDENDCSIRDDSFGWLAGATDRAPRATAACEANPNDPCCRSCALNEDKPPEGCLALSEDAVCKTVVAPAKFIAWDEPHDAANLRCFDQRRRFGLDLLYETSRYVDGLSKQTLPLPSTPGVSVANPLFDPGASGLPPRSESLVFLAGIVGVPWQDIADDASLTGPGLTYLTAEQLRAKDRWQALLGTPNPGAGKPPIPPSDPFMVETTEPRRGKNPFVDESIGSADSTNPHENQINGHEQHVPDLDDLQYACTFPLNPVRPCAKGAQNCDCSPNPAGDSSKVIAANSPLCQGGADINTQTSAKAYPGTRELSVLRDFGDNAIVASICPKVTTVAAGTNPAADPNYGYNPAVGAIIERLKIALNGKCLPRAIQTDPATHQVACKVIEAQESGCDCGLEGRAEADPKLKEAVVRELEATGQCESTGPRACSNFCQCEILQEKDAALEACRQNLSAPAGYCYIDDPASPLLTNCPLSSKHLLRFVSGTDGTHKTPAIGAFAFISCQGEPIKSAAAGGASN